jgi:hypothetical protein
MHLFREAAIAELKQQHYGGIRLIRPPSLMAYTLFFAAIILIIVFFFFTVEASRKILLMGVLVPLHGATQVHPPASDGRISGWANSGQVASAGAPPAILSSEDEPLLADVLAGGATASQPKPGDKAVISYQDYPFQKFGHYYGTVVSLTPIPIGERVSIPGAQSPAIDIRYKIRIRLDEQVIKAQGKVIPLQAGMRLEARIAVERRKLYEWIIPTDNVKFPQ